jgi:hypothetical protein
MTHTISNNSTLAIPGTFAVNTVGTNSGSIFAIHPPGANTWVTGTGGSGVYTIDSSITAHTPLLKLDPSGKIVNIEGLLKITSSDYKLSLDVGEYLVATADYLGLLVRSKEYEEKWDSLREIGEQHTAAVESEVEFGQNVSKLRRLRKEYHIELARIMECDDIVDILSR